MFKCKYFPDADLFSVKIPPTVSFAWRSILESRALIAAGSRWSIDSGASIRLSKDRWLLRPISFRPTASYIGWRKDAVVACLMDSTGTGWDVDFVRALFRPHDAECILEVPVHRPNAGDYLLWYYDKKGRFSVRSAYRLALMTDEAANSLLWTGSTSGNSSDWNFIWTTKVPPKVQLFAWRMCKNAVHTSENLIRRGVKLMGGCPLCSSVTENMEHTLLWCHFSRQVWALALFPWSVVSQFHGGIEDWLRLMKRRLDTDEFSLLLIICWLLWGARNRILFEGHVSTTADLVLQARRLLQVFHGVDSKIDLHS
ncbi:UNVERIFIED_CONTAM: hypothetical protein Slati_1712800 [Sesamum latifolium]|uniref:Reverse transcriptase zinc-binding domain-containing protein n=1 Tax=Sesamum latifolium TaxID=2727402 RepID=A0AAW2WUX9_9LAMI